MRKAIGSSRKRIQKLETKYDNEPVSLDRVRIRMATCYGELGEYDEKMVQLSGETMFWRCGQGGRVGFLPLVVCRRRRFR